MKAMTYYQMTNYHTSDRTEFLLKFGYMHICPYLISNIVKNVACLMCVLCTSAACYDSTKCIINTHDGSFSLQLYRSMFCAAVISGARAIKPLQGYIIPFSFDILISTVRYSVRSGVVLTCQNIRGDIRMP